MWLPVSAIIYQPACQTSYSGNQFQVPIKSISVTCNDPQAPTASQVSYVYEQGSTASKQTIDLSIESPIIDGATTVNSSVGSVSTSSTSTLTTGSTSTSSTQTTGTTTASLHSLSGTSPVNGQDQGQAEDRKGGMFEVAQTDALSPSTTPAAGRNSTEDGFFGAVGGNDADSSSSSSSQTTVTTSSTRPTSTNNSGAYSLNASILPVISTALLMALVLIL